MQEYFSPTTSVENSIKMQIKLICCKLNKSSKILLELSTKTTFIINTGTNYYHCFYTHKLIIYIFRDTLKRHYLLGRYFLDVEIEDLAGFDENLADKIKKQPTEHLQIFEEAAKEVADEITAPRPEGEEVQDIQILLTSNANPTNIRELKSDMVSRLVKIAGVVISASGIKAKTTKISIQCRSCNNTIPNLSVNPGLEGYALPRKCST